MPCWTESQADKEIIPELFKASMEEPWPGHQNKYVEIIYMSFEMLTLKKEEDKLVKAFEMKMLKRMHRIAGARGCP